MTTTRKRPKHVELPLPRDARVVACTGCGLTVLVGRDGDAPIGHVVVVDVWPLTPALERAAVLLGRSTHRVWRSPRGGRLLHRRDQFALGARGTPVGPDVPVVAEHVCGQPLRAGDATVLDVDDDRPPFWGGADTSTVPTSPPF